MEMVKHILSIGLFLLVAGCSVNVSRFQLSDTDLSQIQRLHINIPADERQADELRSLVTTNLLTRGVNVAPGDVAEVYGVGDYVLEIAPDWDWDITWYLLELRIAIYEPKDKTLIAQAHSRQPSLVRKGIEAVVERTMVSLFDNSKKATGEEQDETDE